MASKKKASPARSGRGGGTKKAAGRASKPAPAAPQARKRAGAARRVAAGPRKSAALSSKAKVAARGTTPTRAKTGAPTSKASRAGRGRPARELALEQPLAVPGLSEEDQIRAAKFLPRELPKRLFEEERFLFPETYGVNRVRLLVRDPEWIFAYWDVSPASMKDLGRSLGERALALSRLTLRVVDPVSGGSSDILLPPGARWWYIRTDSARRTYRAELGVTLPSGEFRRLAESNTVVTPRVGPSPERARRRMSYRDARDLPPSAAEAASLAERAAGMAGSPWSAESFDGAAEPGESGKRRGGASDAFRPGGASDTFRR